ncbi:hypothetical protein ACFCW4_37210, partial [Streptomyces virginiae]
RRAEETLLRGPAPPHTTQPRRRLRRRPGRSPTRTPHRRAPRRGKGKVQLNTTEQPAGHPQGHR